MKRAQIYVFLICCWILTLTACRDFNEAETGKGTEETAWAEGTEGFPEASGHENPESSESSGEDMIYEEDAPKEMQKKVFLEEETIFDGVLPVMGMLSLYKNEGDTGVGRTIYDRSAAEKILADILETGAERAEDWTPEMAAFPIYEIAVFGGDGRLKHAAWCNGYWFSPNGVPYKFDYDFEALIDGYDWAEQRTSDRTGALLTWEWFNREGWFPCTLWPAAELPEPQEGLTVRTVSMKDNILTVEIANSGMEDWLYGELFVLDVLLDGIWYGVPPLPDAWGFDDYGLGLGAGESVIREYDFTMYFGVLPEGEYRLRISDDRLAVEFSVE